MKKLKVGVIDFLTNSPRDNWFQNHLIHPNFSSIMPQAIAVWLEELGCEVYYDTYVAQDLFGAMPKDLDVVFLACFTRASFLAYGVSQEFRRRGVITVLGGPHARSFTEHSRDYFDYVCLLTDKNLIASLMAGIARQPRAIVLAAEQQPQSLPGAEQRQHFIDINIKKSTRFLYSIPMLGSFGCPYTCGFCIDASIPYQPLSYDGLIEDLKFSERRWGKDIFVIWHDPNFGVRFKDYMQVVEESRTSIRHIAESSLSLLHEDNLKVLKKNNFVVTLPGIESWFEFSAKSGQKRASGEMKMKGVAAHVNQIQSYIPYMQTNFVFGLDCDEGPDPWNLTKQFIDLAPGVLPTFNLFTNFQNAPLSKTLDQEGRTTFVPYPLLDGRSAFNVKLKNYDPIEFYDRLIDLMEHTWSLKAFARRFQANSHWTAKAINLGRGYVEGRERLKYYRQVRQRLDTDRDFLAFSRGEREEPPMYFFDIVRYRTGRYADLIPKELTTPRGFVESVKRTTHDAPATGSRALLPLARRRP